jgi:hypothetical protein
MLFEQKSAVRETDADGIVRVSPEGHLLRPKDAPRKTVPISMHPTGVPNCLPMPIAMTKHGCRRTVCSD